MHLVYVLPYLVYFICLSAGAPNNRGDVIPDNVAQFGNMITCTTGLNQLKAFANYNEYGCYCGLGGYGTPLDATDQCCVVHDDCYDQVMRSGLCFADNQVYAITYYYDWDQCKTDQASITCKESNDNEYDGHQWPECAKMMCECDKAGAVCFAANRDSYNEEYKRYDKDALCKKV